MAVGGLPLALHTVAAARASSSRGREYRSQDYRWLVSHSLIFLVAAVGMVLLLALPGLGVDVDRHPWVLPLRLAAVAGAFSCPGRQKKLPRQQPTSCQVSPRSAETMIQGKKRP